MSNFDILYSNGWESTGTSGEEMHGRCPSFNHIDVNPSFSINVTTGAFRCFSCGFKGKHPATLLAGIKNISYEEAKSELFGEQYSDEKRRILSINIRLSQFFYNAARFDSSGVVWKALEYRGYGKEIQEKYCIGYVSPETTRFFTNEELELVGMMKNGMFMPEKRMSFPIYSGNNIVGFSCRDLTGSSSRKYLSIYNKEYYPESSWMYGLKNGREVVLCEGVFDAIKLMEAGYNAAALLGSHCSQERMMLLRRFKNIVLAFDNDAAGISATENMYFNSRKILFNNIILVSELFYGKDPDSLTQTQIETVMSDPTPILQWIVMKAFYTSSSPEELIAKISSLRAKIVNIPDEFERNIVNKLIDIRSNNGLTFDFNDGVFSVNNF